MKEYKDALTRANEYNNAECWYIVKQTQSFKEICEALSVFEDYKKLEMQENIEEFFRKRNIVHRKLVSAYNFGLLEKFGSDYKSAELSEVYYSVKVLCNGDFTNSLVYQKIIDQQIEKLYISNKFDEERNGVREGFKLYPIFVVYKVLLLLGDSKNKYEIEINEFKSILGTIKDYSEVLQAVLDIIRFRNDSKFKDEILKNKDKVSDIRLNKTLENLSTLNVTRDKIELKNDKIEEVRKKVYLFEKDIFNKVFDENEYYSLLLKNQPLFNDEIETKNQINLPEINLECFKKSKNRIIYGAPGVGKSNKLKVELRDYPENLIFRTTFYPDFSFSKFLGSYRPFLDENNNVSYGFEPGVFSKILLAAYQNPGQNYVLIIEELNRANAAAVFGDIFQLLDRDENGKSKYEINVPLEMEKWLKSNGIELSKIYIPENLYIWSTLNTSDQGVYPLDSAFKRRWEFEYISINFGEETIKNKYIYLDGIYYEWNKLRKSINKKLTEFLIPEDRQIGTFFINPSLLNEKDNDIEIAEKNLKIIEEKLLMYLSEDLFRHNKERILGFKTLGEILENGLKFFIEFNQIESIIEEL